MGIKDHVDKDILLLYCKSTQPVGVTQYPVEMASSHIAIYHKKFHDVDRGHPDIQLWPIGHIMIHHPIQCGLH